MQLATVRALRGFFAHVGESRAFRPVWAGEVVEVAELAARELIAANKAERAVLEQAAPPPAHDEPRPRRGRPPKGESNNAEQ